MRSSSRLGGIARRDLLRAGFGSLVLGASGSLGRSPFWAQAAAARARAGRAHPGHRRTLRRQRRAQHGRALWRRRLLRRPPAHRHQAGAAAQARRAFRLPIRRCRVSSGSTRTAASPSSTASATTSLRSPISPRWRIGRPPRPTAANSMAGSAAPPTPWTREGHANYIVNIDTQQSLAVRSRGHVPLVFDDPQKFVRTGFADETAALKMIAGMAAARTTRRSSCSACRAARLTPSSSCATPGRNTARRSTMVLCASASSAWRR